MKLVGAINVYNLSDENSTNTVMIFEMSRLTLELSLELTPDTRLIELWR